MSDFVRRTTRRTAILVIAVVLAGASCGGQNRGSAPPSQSPSAAITDASQPPTSTSNGETTESQQAEGTYSPGVEGTGSERCKAGEDCLVAFVNQQTDWGCDLRPGEACKIPFSGYWALISAESGSVAFVAMENDSETPAYAQEIAIPPLPRRGSLGVSTRLLYTVGAGAKWITFQVLLKDSKGTVVARSFPERYPAGA